EEPALTDYITTLIKQHKSPNDILSEVDSVLDNDAKVESILDNDAKVFVVKMWRMLCFEVLKADVDS
ncbi:hypothetical protein T484DRAFT_1807696, partial [Baffinella frigidus]